MNLSISINKERIDRIRSFAQRVIGPKLVLVLSTIFSIAAITVSYFKDWIVRYGDAESHLDIAKRVISGLTPGFAQLGGIWLPLPHLLMVPFVWSDFLWRSGLAGAIVSGIAFIISSVFLYKTTFLIINSKTASLVASLVFMLNPNMLYMQSTPMTELVLICFFILSTYYFIKFLYGERQLTSLLFSAFWGFCAVLSRYDGWFLIGLEAGILVIYYVPWKKIGFSFRNLREFIRSKEWQVMEGSVLIFVTLALFGVILWLVWGFLILGDPLYFMHSQFSAGAQQQVWLAHNQLPAYHNLWMAFLYYFVTAMSNAGILIYFPAIVGLIYYLANEEKKHRYLIMLLFAAPFIFNVITLFLGQSVIFIPHLTPPNWDNNLFNVRYGLMTVPLVAFAFGYLFYKVKNSGKILLLGLFLFQFALYGVGYSQVIDWQDGETGLSASIRPDAEQWIHNNYDYGLVLMDDYARTVSVIRSGIPMQNMIYVGNKPYWQQSLVDPQKYARWIVMQKNDEVWNALWTDPTEQAKLFTYFDKVYTSPDILIFRRQKNPVPTNDIWSYKCVDTVKYSRDAAREWVKNPEVISMIDAQVSAIADMGANCISIGTPYDPEFVPYMTDWVKEARKYNLHVWFRGNLSGWEGWFNYPKFTTLKQHDDGITKFVTSNPTLFEAGDIFTPAPEPENGFIGDPRNSAQSKALFTQFLPESYDNCVQAFIKVNVTGVSCGYFSVNGDVAKQILTKDLVARTGGVVVIDHYLSDPNKVVSDAVALAVKYGAKVALGEYGAPIPDLNGNMTEDQQAQYINTLLKAAYLHKDVIAALNYWALSGSSTALLNDDGSPRKAVDTIKQYYASSEIQGTVLNSVGEAIPNATVTIDDGLAKTQTNVLGEFDAVVPSYASKLDVAADNYKIQSQNLNLKAGNITQETLKLEPTHKDWRYYLKEFFAALR